MILDREAALYIAAVAAAINLAVAFGVALTEVQQQALLQGATAVISLIVGGVVTRASVFSKDTVEREYIHKAQATLDRLDDGG